MSSEQETRPPRPNPTREFGFSEKEDLFDRVSHQRLLEFLEDETTDVHRVEFSSNNYGEFFFVTVSRPGLERRIWVSFYGLGYHEGRERWLTDEWFWYRANPLPKSLEQEITREEALERLRERREELSGYIGESTQSSRGRLFEMLADLTDEDGAYTELEDLGGLADWLLDDE